MGPPHPPGRGLGTSSWGPNRPLRGVTERPSHQSQGPAPPFSGQLEDSIPLGTEKTWPGCQPWGPAPTSHLGVTQRPRSQQKAAAHLAESTPRREQRGKFRFCFALRCVCREEFIGPDGSEERHETNKNLNNCPYFLPSFHLKHPVELNTPYYPRSFPRQLKLCRNDLISSSQMAKPLHPHLRKPRLRIAKLLAKGIVPGPPVQQFPSLFCASFSGPPSKARSLSCHVLHFLQRGIRQLSASPLSLKAFLRRSRRMGGNVINKFAIAG